MRLGRTQAKAEVPATAALPERDPASSGEYRSLPPSPHGPASFVGEITPPLPHPAIPAEGSWAPVPPPGAWAAGPPAYGPPGYQPPIPPGFASGPPPGMPAYPPHVAPAYAYPPGFPPPPAAYGPPPGSPNTTGRFAAPAFANSTGRFAAPLPQGPEASMAMRPSTDPYAPPPGYGPPPSSGNLPVLPPQSFPPAPEPPPMRPDVTGRFAALVAPPGPESSGSWPVYGAWSPPPPRPASGYHAPNQAPPVPPIGFGYPPKK